MRRSSLAALAAVFASCALVTAPAHADPEIELIQCAGSLTDTALREPGRVDSTGTISCAKGHVATTEGSTTTFTPWFTAATTIYLYNDPVLPDGLFETYLTNGEMTFTVNNATWRVHIDTYHLVSGGVLHFDGGYGAANGYLDDWVGPSALPDKHFHIHDGWMVTRNCYVPFIDIEHPCVETGFQFTGEYVHDIPVTP